MKQVVLVDDLDGKAAEETIKFGIDGDHYEVDLSSGNAEKLRTLLAPYRKVARPTRLRSGKPSESPASSPRRVKSPQRKKNGVPSSADIRSWAAEKGIKVNATGRIPNSLVEQYTADTKG